MSVTQTTEEIEYPESDGKPMGETDLHRDWMIRILDILRQRYRGQRVYIASDLLVYYEEGQPTRYVVPDDFVVLDCDPGRRRIFRTWKEGRTLDVVFEVTSRGTSTHDIVDKPVIYERMGVKEYFLYDPTGDYLEPALQGFRLIDGVFSEIKPVNGQIDCATLGIKLGLTDGDLMMLDSVTRKQLLTEAEFEHESMKWEREARFEECKAKEAERMAKDAERMAKDVERMAKDAERMAKEQERMAKEQERKEKEEERAGRIEAEARIRELQDEIARLKRNLEG